MKLTILIIICVLGLMVPLFWLIGTATGMIYYYRRRVGAPCDERLAALNPHLGFTMADGGESIAKEEKK